jgi:hypothetical protein
LFLKTAETERRIRASVTRDASAAATVAFALFVGAVTNAVTALNAKYLGLDSTCVCGSSGLVFALKTYRARVDFRTGYRGRVSFFGFIEVPAEMASLAEIAILYMLDSSPAMLNLYGSGALVGFVLASTESVAMQNLAKATRMVKLALGLATRSTRYPRAGSRVVLSNMRNGSLNGKWGTVESVSTFNDEVRIKLDEGARVVSALHSNLIIVS